jgi:3-oxoadipate enol-lactonase
MAGGGAAALPAVHDTGDGPVLLWLHAFPLDASQWDHQVAALSGRYRCLRVDIWGCGDSPPPPGAPSLESFTRAVMRALDECHVDRFTACGLSLGGYLIWELLRIAPERISTLILCSTRATADTQARREHREKTAHAVTAGGVETLVEESVGQLLSKQSQAEVHVADPVRGRIRRCTPEGIAWTARAMGSRPDSTPLLARIDVPTLVIAGAEDAVVASSDQRAMADEIRGAEFVEISGCGHLTNLEAPPRFDETVTAFLARQHH